MTLHIRRHHQRHVSTLDRGKPNLPRFAKLQARCWKGAAVSASDDCSFAPYETHFAPETTARLHGLPAVPGSSFSLQCHPDFDIASALVSQPCETLSRGIPDTRGKDPAPARLPGQVRPLGKVAFFFFRRASPGRLDDCPAGRSQTCQPTLTVSLLSRVALSCPSASATHPVIMDRATAPPNRVSLPAALDQARIPCLPATAYYIPDFISEEEEKIILDKVRAIRHPQPLWSPEFSVRAA